jgi:hypothetical protein
VSLQLRWSLNVMLFNDVRSERFILATGFLVDRCDDSDDSSSF